MELVSSPPDAVVDGRPRVLVIAEAANPEWVSVPLVGWSLAQALREVADVHLVTQVRNRDAILRAGLVEGVDFTAIDSEALARPMYTIADKLRMGEGKGWTVIQAMNVAAYPYFEHLVWKTFGSRIEAGDFDIVHRVTPLSPTVSSLIAPRCAKAGVPFVLGPLNGGVPWPAGFDADRRREREWLSYVRGAYKILPGRRSTLRHSAAILAGSRHTASELPETARARCVFLPENGVDPARFSAARTEAPPSQSPSSQSPSSQSPSSRTPIDDVATPVLRACFIGRLVPYKGADMLIESAAPLLRKGRLVIDVIGDGPMLHDLRALTVREDVTEAVHFHGWLAHERVQDVAAASSLLAFPSIREFGGGVVLEAMALGLAPLIVDYAGPGELVTEGTGFKVALGTRDEIVARFRRELARLADDPDAVASAGAAARARVEAAFTWPRKAAQVAQVYDWVLGKRVDRPSFF